MASTNTSSYATFITLMIDIGEKTEKDRYTKLFQFLLEPDKTVLGDVLSDEVMLGSLIVTPNIPEPSVNAITYLTGTLGDYGQEDGLHIYIQNLNEYN